MEDKVVLFKKQENQYNTTIYKDHFNLPKNELKPNTSDDPFSLDYPIKVTQLNFYSRKRGTFEYDDQEYKDEESFLKNYGNIFAYVTHSRQTLVIEQKEKNIAIKVFSYNRYRTPGSKYFVVRRNLKYLTFNFNKKMFYAGEITSKLKKTTGKRQTFDVRNLEQSCSSLYYQVAHILKGSCETNTFFDIFYNVIINKLQLKVDKNLSPNAKHFLIYLKIKNIKYPNAYLNFCDFHFKLKDLKKQKNNLVNYAMDYLGLRGNNIRKIFNKNVGIDLVKVQYFYHLLGVDYFNKIKNTDIFSHTFYSNSWYRINRNEINQDDITNTEKSNIVSLIDSLTYNEQLETIREHIHFKEKLKKHQEYVKIKSKTHDEFITEHEEWSKLLASYKGGYIERYYGENANNIEKTIICDKDLYYPVLLKTTEQYESESLVQRNCVRTYSQRPDCLIISLRKNSPDSTERLTIEYQYRKNKILNVQTRARFNDIASEEWVRAINVLDDTVNLFYVNKTIDLPKITKTYKNGKSVESYSIFPEEEKMHFMTPVWEDSSIYSDNNNYLFYGLDELP